MSCVYCGTNQDVRPYGPNATDICFTCMKATPEREATAAATFGVLLAANQAISSSGAVAIGDGPPRPFDPNEAPTRNTTDDN